MVIAPESMEAADRHVASLHTAHPVSEYDAEMMLPDGRRVRTEVSSIPLENVGLCCGAFGIAGAPLRPGRPARKTDLTPRQLEVLSLLTGGASTDQIAAELYLSKTTVRNHIARLMATLGVHSRLAAVAKARREGLVAV